ncbi:hypothetical protein [Streptomyces erythrochromogenes]|uniref:hypothetical protein n=1 Tax=Streptomyces erythrochromogenes TaxID=285574 RepID=UPI00225B30A8|nr:hypothetical protein [Streptomyces erythrochromogenes]MCX5587576.1 hypothetical protein [Streptomyces erythrochromogenes]
MNTTATTLRTLIATWPDLHAALGDRPIHGAYGLGLRGYLAAIEHHDPTEAAALRAEERDPAQLGDRPVPLNLAIYDTMRAIEAALAHCAEVTAAAVQIEPIPLPGPEWPAADRPRRAAASRADLADRRRWRYGRSTPPATYTALWLLARTEQRPGPFRPLTAPQAQYIGGVARGALARAQDTLDTAGDRRTELGPEHRCQCGGLIEVWGGGGATPCARCTGCGALWTEKGVMAA